MSEFFQQNWGNVASVVGLAVSMCVLWVAQKAKEAAQAAQSAARLKSLVEELEEANNKTHRAGTYLRDRKWEIAQFLTDETLGACRSAMARWGDYLLEAKNDLLDACRRLESVGDNCRVAATRQLTDDEWGQTMRAQHESLALVSTALGAARRAEERKHEKRD